MEKSVMTPRLMPWEPHPCLGHGTRTFDPFHSKTEVQKAYPYVVTMLRYTSALREDWNEFVFDPLLKDKIAERLTYVITAAATALEAIGYDLEKRRKMQENENEENRKRGYHDEA